MNKALHALVYVILAVAGVALFFEIKLYEKRELLTERNDQFIDYLVNMSKTIEKADAPKPTTLPEARKDVSPIEAKAVDTPETENLLEDYPVQREQQNLETLMWDDKQRVGIVRLAMRDVAVSDIRRCLDGWFLDTGSPHYVQRVVDLEHYDVVTEGRRLRHLTDEFPEGTNVNFVEDLPDGRLMVRTYERGVEDETWACGTGVTACAIVSGNQRLVTRGGDFKVTFQSTGTAYRQVQLTGPVACNFEGEWTINH